MKTSLLLCLSLLWLFSCARPSIVTQPDEGKPEIQATPVVSSPEVVSATSSTKREPLVAVILGPGLNRSSAHIAFLRGLERRGVKVSLIEGHEMGALIAALYAQTQSAERVEWSFYKYFRKNERVEAFTENWRKGIETELLGSFCQKASFESLKLKLILPVYHTKEKRLQYFERGNLCQLLMSTLIPGASPENYSASFEWGLYNSSALKKAGADLVIGVDVLGEKILFRKENAEIKKLYEGVRKIRNVEKRYVDLFVALPTEDMPLDGLENLPLVSKKTSLQTEKVVKDIQTLIKQWKEKNP